MNGVNLTILLGNLGAAPELRYTPNGNSVCNFSVATNESWVKDGERQERTEWHKIVAWGRLAEVCNEYLDKGSPVYVQGKFQTRTWEDDEGRKHYTTEVVAREVRFLGGKREGDDDGDRSEDLGQGGAKGAGKEPPASTTTEPYDNDLPF